MQEQPPKNTARFERQSLSYGLFLCIGYLYYRVFYRRFRVVGRNTIPKGVPVIFVANHQNALMDDIAVLYGTRKQVAIMSRADLFKNRILARIFNWFKMIPVYRPRDGMENMDRNEVSFQRAASVLNKGRYINIFPEGNHAMLKRLRPLKKGICRIAFLAEEKAGFQLGLKVMPVGLDFSDYYRSGADLLILFGKPITVSDYRDIYLENPVKAVNQLRDDISVSLKEVMIHIESEKHYDTLAFAMEMMYRKILRSEKQKENLFTGYTARRALASRLNAAIAKDENQALELKRLIEPYQEKLHAYGLRDWVVEKGNPGILKLASGGLVALVVLPLHLYGIVLNYLPYKIPVLISRRVKDRIFHTSLNFGISLFLFPLYYLLVISVAALLGAGWKVLFVLLLSLPVTGLTAFYHFRFLKRLRGRIRFALLAKRNPQAYNSLMSMRTGIIQYIETLTGLKH